MEPTRRQWVGGLAGVALRGMSSGGRHARWWFAGDVHLGDGLPRLAPALRRRLRGCGVVNLEGPVGPSPFALVDDVHHTVRLRNHPRAVSGLTTQGVGVVTIANNHRFDAGPRSLQQTVAQLPPGLEVTGDERVHTRGRPRPVRVAAFELRDSTVALDAAWSRLRVPDQGVLVVSLHVTGPPSYLPQPQLRAAVERALEAGARIVVAHGTHVLGPVECRESAAGPAVVAYGLGNLWFSCSCTRSREGLALVLHVLRDRLDVELVPIDAGLDGASATLAADPELAFDLLAAIGSSPEVHSGRLTLFDA